MNTTYNVSANVPQTPENIIIALAVIFGIIFVGFIGYSIYQYFS
jgi:preprotein translocase subunit Sss1